MSHMKKKSVYEVPETEVLVLNVSGSICTSINPSGTQVTNPFANGGVPVEEEEW